jgi:tRNA/tmRNA/rRNA uracil-C5-methylase (TrmA/RlmC/RlmD family)
MDECPYFGKCAGCRLQHTPYERQIENKLKQVRSALGFDDVKAYFSSAFGCRNRMDFFFGKPAIGLRDRAGKIIDIEMCAIANSTVRRLFAEIRAGFRNPCKAFSGAIVRAPCSDSGIVFVLDSRSSKIREAVKQVRNFSTSAKNVVIKCDDNIFAVKGSEYLQAEYLGKRFTFPAEGFFQNNDAVAEMMHRHVRQMLGKYDTGGAELLDLYAGAGTFGSINADMFSKVCLFESSCLAQNLPENCAFYHKDAEQVRNLKFSRPVYVITDPPRTGMSMKVIEHLRSLKPEVIVYVSCNLMQVRKDILKLGCRIKSAAMFDMFPHTYHIETVAELEQNI